MTAEQFEQLRYLGYVGPFDLKRWEADELLRLYRAGKGAYRRP